MRLRKSSYADVAVIGGGTAGVFAAISSALAGARTVLVEKNGALGGTMTLGGVCYPGLFFAWGKQIIGGKCWEMIRRVEAYGGTVIPTMEYAPEKHWTQQVKMNPFTVCCVLDEMCAEAGVELRLHTMLSDAEEQENGVELLLTGKEGLEQLCVKQVIDATGDADLVRMLGYPCEKSASLQPATLYLRGKAITPTPDLDALTQKAKEATEAGLLPPWIAPHSYAKLVRGLNITAHVACPADADTSEGKTRLEQAARRDCFAAVRFIRSVKGCESFEVADFAVECGVRETNRIVGEACVSAEDYISGRRFEDAICNAFYPIDRHQPPYEIKQVFFEEGKYATVPYGALIPKNSRRLLAAGRILSADTDANSALRVQAVCMASGQAAGCAAALCAKQELSPRQLPLPLLRQELSRQGAILP